VEAATPKAEKKGDLKKQSQFVPGQNGATSCVKGDYDNKLAGGDDKNKAKQSQLHTCVPTKSAGKGEKPATSANG
jgi:hypothetical protein